MLPDAKTCSSRRIFMPFSIDKFGFKRVHFCVFKFSAASFQGHSRTHFETYAGHVSERDGQGLETPSKSVMC